MLLQKLSLVPSLLLAVSSLSLWATTSTTTMVHADHGSDYITEVPLTVYEAEEMSPQNIDYDMTNRVFPAHSGWYNDRLIHYYKFHIYAPPTYPDVITSESSAMDVPMQKIYMVTMDGTMDGVIGYPIIEYHHVDGVMYSDYMEVVLVHAPENYTENWYKSVGDIMEEVVDEADMIATGIILNIPVVPTNATLQDPGYMEDEGDMVSTAQTGGLQKSAPIFPTPVWYKGMEIWTYVLEVTDQVAADYFGPMTRDDPSDMDFAIPVMPYATPSTGISAIPLAHLNQYTVGVTDSNFGGPSNKGMRNIINLNRMDAGYSPLWQLWWVTSLPINYSADQVSNIANLQMDYGFDMIATPIFVNCPTIGSVATSDNPMMMTVTDFEMEIDMMNEMNWILGSDASLILMPNVTVEFHTGNTSMTPMMMIGSTMTNMLGAYEYMLSSSDIPAGTMSIDVVANGQVIRTLQVGMKQGDEESNGNNDSSMSSGSNANISLLIATTSAMMLMAATILI